MVIILDNLFAITMSYFYYVISNDRMIIQKLLNEKMNFGLTLKFENEYNKKNS